MAVQELASMDWRRAKAEEHALKAWRKALLCCIYFSVLLTFAFFLPQIEWLLDEVAPVLTALLYLSFIFMSPILLCMQVWYLWIGFEHRRTVLGKRTVLLIASFWFSAFLHFYDLARHYQQ